ncbi:MAG TPA: type II toxin-antitoxin system death-on-curing family toxin [Gryllotalpicola sp.]
MIFLDVEDLLQIATRDLGGPPQLRDRGLLEAAVARPQASYLGEALYPTLALQGAALMHSIAKNHALVDGNKRLAVSALAGFLWFNGMVLDFDDDDLFRFVLDVASGAIEHVEDIAAWIEAHSRPRR